MRAIVLALLASLPVSAAGLDRDTLLTDAPATPDKGTVRVTAGGTDTSSGASGTGNLIGSIGWSPIDRLHLDVGAYFQTGAQGGPSARARFQLATQAQLGIDLTAGVRWKTVSFRTSGCAACAESGEVEFLLLAGRRIGRLELVLNGVFGVETGGGGGKDLEVKSFAGARLSESVRAGVEERLQAEVSDNETPGSAPSGRDYDLTAGPTLSVLIGNSVQLQALLGVAQPKRTNETTGVGIVSASLDF